MRKKIRKVTIALLLLILLAGCNKDALNLGKIKGIVEVFQGDKNIKELEITQEEEVFLYGYQTLAEEERVIYRQLAFGIREFQEEISTSPITEERLGVVFNRVMIDHPEYFWTEGAFQYSMETWTDGSVTDVKVMPNYLMGKEEAEEKKVQIEARAQEWLAGIQPEEHTYEKIKYVYETLIKEVDYDAESPNNQNIQSVFLEGRTVCMGYSKATQYLLNKMGIFCTLVTGTTLNGTEAQGTDTSHAWNLVKIEDQFYYIDTTWGNPGYSENQNPEIDVLYSYLCCNDAMLASTHKANMDIPLPGCLDDSYNYYKNKGCWYEQYNENQMYEILRKEAYQEHHITEFCFASREDYNQAVEDFVNGDFLKKAVEDSNHLLPGQQISWQIYYGGWDNLLTIIWN